MSLSITGIILKQGDKLNVSLACCDTIGMTQEVVYYVECKFCWSCIQFQGQGHRCPVPLEELGEFGTARDQPSPQFLVFLDKLTDPNIKSINKSTQVFEFL